MKIVVTGGTKGIGLGIVQELIENGHEVGILARSEDIMMQLSKEYATSSLFWDVVDFINPAEAVRALNRLILHMGGIDALVNNAGVIDRSSLADIDLQQFEYMMRVNVTVPLALTQAVAPQMEAQEFGHIINISSISGKLPLPNGAGYAASKYALTGISESLFMELRDQGIKVSTIFPGSVYSASRNNGGQDWKVQPREVGQAVLSMLQTSPQNCIRELEIRPLRK
ncbi:MAG: SDR family oxidoreductase [Lentisphaeria bacterium]|nr:SDR family oxidoreductase [Lentisphaeria bacterium]